MITKVRFVKTKGQIFTYICTNQLIMRRYLLVLLFFTSSLSFAQLHSAGFQLGAMATSMGSNFYNGDAKIKIDFLGGLNYQYRFSNHLTIGADIEYAQFGARVRELFFDWQGTQIAESWSSWDWNYISIPLTVGFKMGGKIRFTPMAGITPSILARSVYNFKPYEGSSLTPTKTSFYSDAKKFDLGLIAGGDVSFPFHEGVVFVGLDFRYSITKVNTDSFFTENFFDPYRHRGLNTVFGVRFNIGNPEPEGPKDLIDDPVK